jgi:hypothetical protein
MVLYVHNFVWLSVRLCLLSCMALSGRCRARKLSTLSNNVCRVHAVGFEISENLQKYGDND